MIILYQINIYEFDSEISLIWKIIALWCLNLEIDENVLFKVWMLDWVKLSEILWIIISLKNYVYNED